MHISAVCNKLCLFLAIVDRSERSIIVLFGAKMIQASAMLSGENPS